MEGDQMDIEDAFTREIIDAAGTNVEGESERQLREVIKRIYVGNEINWADEHLNVASLCFVAGRTYQMDQEQDPNPVIAVPMSLAMVGEYIEYLSRRE